MIATGIRVDNLLEQNMTPGTSYTIPVQTEGVDMTALKEFVFSNNPNTRTVPGTDSCTLCLDIESNDGSPIWNEPLYETDHFVVIPSLGALVEGWLLLVPRDHFVCVGAIPESLTAEMLGVKRKVLSVLNHIYSTTYVFEHGPSTARRRVGCGVDHAHLHFVPISFDLTKATLPLLPDSASWSTANEQSCRHAYLHGKDYLYLEDFMGRQFISVHADIGSQLFRRAIAKEIGAPDEYNWREYPRLEVVTETVRQLKARFEE